MTRSKASLSDFPDALQAFEHQLDVGDYSVEFASKQEADAFRARCHRFRRLYAAQLDAENDVPGHIPFNKYAMILISLTDNKLTFRGRVAIQDLEPQPLEERAVDEFFANVKAAE